MARRLRARARERSPPDGAAEGAVPWARARLRSQPKGAEEGAAHWARASAWSRSLRSLPGEGWCSGPRSSRTRPGASVLQYDGVGVVAADTKPVVGYAPGSDTPAGSRLPEARDWCTWHLKAVGSRHTRVIRITWVARSAAGLEFTPFRASNQPVRSGPGLVPRSQAM
jgi:hypothetical protein